MGLMTWSEICWISYERGVRNGDKRCVIDAGGEVRIFCTLVWGYERGGSYVPCSHLRLL